MRPVITPDTPDVIDVVLVDGGTYESHPLDVLDYPTTERAWLPILGPSAMVLARHLVTSDRGIYPMSELARDLGIGVPRLWAAFKRLERFDLVEIVTPDWSPHPIIRVRAHWPMPKAKEA